MCYYCCTFKLQKKFFNINKSGKRVVLALFKYQLAYASAYVHTLMYFAITNV